MVDELDDGRRVAAASPPEMEAVLRPDERGPVRPAVTAAARQPRPRPDHDRPRFTIRPAEPDDSPAIADYLAEHFGHVYLEVFAGSAEEQRAILEELLRRTVDLPLSHRAFFVALDARPPGDKVVGVLGVSPPSPSSPTVPTQDIITSAGVVATRLGVRGLLRSFVQDVPLLADLPPARRRDELLIASIATHPEWRRHDVASALIDHLKSWALERSFRTITAEVRADNRPALAFFTKNGFRREGEEIHGWRDRRLGLAPRVRMVLPLVAGA